MIWLIFTLAAAGADAPDRLVIPGHFLRAEARWADLDRDGALDIWVIDALGSVDERGEATLWLRDGAEPEAGFRPLRYDPALTPKPAKTEAGWRVQARVDGATFEYGEDGWAAIRDENRIAPLRPGTAPIEDGGFTLLPTFEGYWLLEDDCPAQPFAITPAVEIQKRALRLIYPKPYRRDIDGDGRDDLLAAPVPFRQSAELRVWSALRVEAGWREQWAAVQFPPELKPLRSRFGDLNGDGFADLVVLARQAENLSLFEEMSFVVYLGSAPGQWRETPIQVLKTKQKLWQNGPVEVNRQGILLMYYKGLFKARFAIDRFRWRDDGFIDPKPVSETWRVKGGERDEILTRFDVNGDGRADLILQGREGVFAHYRQPGRALPFDEDPSVALFDDFLSRRDRKRLRRRGEEPELDSLRRGVNMRVNRARGDGSLAIVGDPATDRPMLWKLYEDESSGHWVLMRLY